MKNHELLDMIGDVNEDYVQAADSNVVRPRFRWKGWAAAAACFALIAAAYPISQVFQPQAPGPEASRSPDDTLVQRPGLHSYVLVEEGRYTVTTQMSGEEKLPSFPHAVGGGAEDDPAPSETAVPPGSEQSGDVPVQEGVYYYDRLMQGMGVPTDGSPAVYPDWFGGAWLDGDQEKLLTVAIVYGFRTPELEEQIRGWCGGTQEVQFTGAIYSQNHLDGLMKEIDRVFEELDCRVFLSYGVYPSDNCIHLDFFDIPDDGVLAALAELDPDGGAIYVQVFTDRRNVLTDGSGQEFSCDPGDASPQPTPAETSQGDVPAAISVAPGGVTQPAVDGLPVAEESPMPAQYDAQPAEINDLPQAKHDVIDGADE